MATTKVQSELIVDDVALAGNPTTSTQSAGNNTTRIATTAFVTTAVNNLIDSAPGTMDTLNEIAAALGDDPSFTTTVNNAIATKLPLAGGTMSGDLNMGSQDITNLDTLASTHFSSSANVNSSGDGGVFIPSGKRLGFDQSGTRSWTQYAAGGNLLFASGDGNGAIQANNFTGVTLTLSGAITASSVNASGGFLNGSNGGIRIHTGGTKFFNVTAANSARDNIMDIGASDARFKNLHLGGTISSGAITSSGNSSFTGALSLTNTSHSVLTLQAGTNSSASIRLKNDAQDFDLNVQTNDNFALYNHTTTKQPITVSPQGYMTLQHEGSDFGLQIRTNGATRSGLVIDKPNTTSILGSALVLSDETYRLGTASHYHIVMDQNGVTRLYGDDSAVILGVDGTGMFSNKNRYRFTDTTGGEHEVRTGGRNGTGTYTLFTNGSSSTQSAGTVEVWGIYGTPSGASYRKYLISGNRSIATITSEVETNSVPEPTLSWSSAALQITNSNSSLYYHVRVELHDIGYGWSATWGNFPGIS